MEPLGHSMLFEATPFKGGLKESQMDSFGILSGHQGGTSCQVPPAGGLHLRGPHGRSGRLARGGDGSTNRGLPLWRQEGPPPKCGVMSC